MEESESRCARIEDVRVDDFIRFCEYAYRGDYTVPPWEELLPEPSSTPGKNQQNGDGDVWGNLAPSSKKKKGNIWGVAPVIWDIAAPESFPESDSVAVSEVPPMDMDYPQQSLAYDEAELAQASEPQHETSSISKRSLRTKFNSRNYLNDRSPKALILQHFEPKPNSAVHQNFTPVLLAHARLYCFAHLRLIAPLKALTLDKLHKTLMGFKLYTKRIADIVELARYAYSNPDLPDRSDDGTLDDLRKLVVEYIVCEVDTIGKCDEFVKYMEEGGEFVGDFWRVVRDYMV
jgi:hypothetical protein